MKKIANGKNVLTCIRVRIRLLPHAAMLKIKAAGKGALIDKKSLFLRIPM